MTPYLSGAALLFLGALHGLVHRLFVAGMHGAIGGMHVRWPCTGMVVLMLLLVGLLVLLLGGFFEALCLGVEVVVGGKAVAIVGAR